MVFVVVFIKILLYFDRALPIVDLYLQRVQLMNTWDVNIRLLLSRDIHVKNHLLCSCFWWQENKMLAVGI